MKTIKIIAALLMTGGLVAGCGGADASPLATEGYARLIATDPLRHGWNFEEGTYGGVLQEGAVKVSTMHLSYGAYGANALTVAVQGSDVGAIFDLGPDQTLADQLGVEQTVGGGQGFAALSLADVSFNLTTATLLDDATLASASAADAKLGHVYLARIANVSEGRDMIVKMIVVGLDDHAVELEWVRLR